MKKSLLKFYLILLMASIFLFCLIGCSSSEETKTEAPPPPPSATEAMQNEMNNLQSQNESLKKQVSKCEQDNRTAVARAAVLETQLAELKEKGAAPPIVQKPMATNARESYKEALNLFRSRNYAEAASLFQSALDGGIAEKMQDNCYYWLGECAYGEKKYNEAIEHFQKVFTFKISEKKDDSQLMIGNSYLALGNKEKAREAFERFTKKFPASPFIKRVKEKLGKL